MPKGSTKKAADERLQELKGQVKKGVYLPDTKIPYFSKVAKDWVDYKKPKVRETTWGNYKGHIENHFAEFNELRINRIMTVDVEKFITKRQIEGMHIDTLRKVLITLNQIFKYAVRHKYIDHNPYADVEKPKRQRREGEHKRDKISVLTPEQVKDFLENIEGQRYQAMFRLAVFGGPRQGELLGFKWGDVDWENNQIHVQRTYTKGRFFAPKTEESNRKIDLGPAVITELKRWKLACPKNELDLIFPNNAGKPMNYSNMVNRHFFPTLKAAELPRIRFHDLRHTYASLLIEQGENIKYIQTQLGHSKPSTTLNVYAHLFEDKNWDAPRRLEERVFGKNGSRMVAETKTGLRSDPVTP
jgi:integrase